MGYSRFISTETTFNERTNVNSYRNFCIAMFLLFAACLSVPGSAKDYEFDVVVYGGTSGGIATAIQAKRMGKSVALIEPSNHLGGLTSGGLGQTDIGNKGAIGGISREFYRRIKLFYQNDAKWKFEKTTDYKRAGHNDPKDECMWCFEPHVAELIYREMLKENSVTDIFFGERLNRSVKPKMRNGWLSSIAMESGNQFKAKMFVDATYEGDLMDRANVSFTIGREGNDEYGETLNGVQTANAVKHQFQKGVDPYIVKGDPDSGLLPNIEPKLSDPDGTGDHRVQAYNIRICATDAQENRIPWAKPANYNERDFELLFRNFEANEKRVPWSRLMMPNRKTDSNNNFGFSTDLIGCSYDWAEADYTTREKIYQEHVDYTQGLMWTLANHPRVPKKVRDEMSRWGTCKDEFAESKGWSHQLYVREARRMVSDYVMSQHNCQARKIADDSVGLAAYTMDSHNVQRYVDENGFVRNEGDVQVGGFPPFPISYKSIVPGRKECKNLLVPVCLSATHIAFGSIRMEPVFMVLGQSAATAACQAIDQKCAVQNVDYERLKERLIADKQILSWTRRKRAGAIDSKKLARFGIVVDNTKAEKSAGWTNSSSTPLFVGSGYLHNGNENKTPHWVKFKLTAKSDGEYRILCAYSAHPNRASNAPVEVSIGGRQFNSLLNQKEKPTVAGIFANIGSFKLKADQQVIVTISDKDANGFVIADAVALQKQEADDSRK